MSLSPILGAKEQKCLIGHIRGNEALDHSFQNCKSVLESVEPLLKNRDPNITQNEHVYMICDKDYQGLCCVKV